MNRRKLLLLVGSAVLIGAGIARAAEPAPRSSLPRQLAPFTGRIAPVLEDSLAQFPGRPTAPAGAPNVLLVLTDDVGFGSVSTFGGPVPTPNLDKLAARGLVYSRFHTTAMCSPTRAALLSGRNHHAVANGTVADLATGFPGYTSMTPKSAATVAEILKGNGYSTAMFGKHHSLPDWERWPSGPFDNWPIGLGFEQFYGFLGGDTDQYSPKMYVGNAPALQRYDHDAAYIVDKDLADQAIGYIHAQKAATPDKPFLVYLATGTAHAPHQAPSQWMARFRGTFDSGWDNVRDETLKRQIAMGIAPAGTVAPPRLQAIPAWASLTPDQKRVAARMMEAYAAAIAHQDHQFGRIMAELDRMGEADNTLVMFIQGDNGSSSEGGLMGSTNELGTFVNNATEDMAWLTGMLDKIGGPESYGHYPIGWAWAMNAPLPWFKQIGSHLGGTRNGLVVSWPARIRSRGIRTQFAHVTDIAPTILEAAKVKPPEVVNGIEQQRIDGISLLYSFDAADAPERHRTQYFEMIGSRAIYHDGWWANTKPPRIPWQLKASPIPPAAYEWELYDLRSDYAQARNLAGTQPAKLREMQAIFDREARANQVYPLDDRQTMARAAQRRVMIAPRDRYVYWGKDLALPLPHAPQLNGQSYTITADIEIANVGGNGPIVAVGSRFGGWSFFLRDGRPAARMSLSQQPQQQWEVAATERLPAGPARLAFQFIYDGGPPMRGGTMVIRINDREVARGRIERTTFMPAGLGETFDIGDDTGTMVIDYPNGRRFDGLIHKVEVVPGESK